MSEAEKGGRVMGDNFSGRPTPLQPGWSRWLGIPVLGLLVLHSLAYGSFFIVNPVEGAREFGSNEPSSEAAEQLVGLVGVILVLLGVTAAVAALLLLRKRLGGGWLTLGLGIVCLSIAAYWGTRGSAWDFGIYGLFGLLLSVTGAANLRSFMRAGIS